MDYIWKINNRSTFAIATDRKIPLVKFHLQLLEAAINSSNTLLCWGFQKLRSELLERLFSFFIFFFLIISSLGQLQIKSSNCEYCLLILSTLFNYVKLSLFFHMRRLLPLVGQEIWLGMEGAGLLKWEKMLLLMKSRFPLYRDRWDPRRWGIL